MIQIQNLTFGYKKDVALFQGLTASFEAGKIYGLLGKNGAGKTTLLKLITGLRWPNSGNIKVLGFDSYKRLAPMLSNIYMIPEQFLLPNMKLKTYVEIYSKFYPNFDHQLMQQNLREFELESDRKLTEMSYGQQKKFLISFALASGASIILMDEPTNGLDIPSKVTFRRLVAQHLTENVLFIISTHQVRDVEGLIDSLRIIDKGKILLQTDLDEITEKLYFTKVEQLTGKELYSHQVFDGWNVILPRQPEQPQTKVDLELLFTAVISPNSSLLNYLKN